MTIEHVSFERLCDLADGVLLPDDRAEVERHLGRCQPCRDVFARLRGLLDRASSLPSDIEPPGEAWHAIPSRVAPPAPGASGSRRWSAGSWIMRAAAAIVLVAGSSTVTVLALRSRERTEFLLARGHYGDKRNRTCTAAKPLGRAPCVRDAHD